MTTEGDLIYYTSGSAARLGIGANGTVLTSNGTDPSWQAATGGAASVTLESTDGSITVASVSAGTWNLTNAGVFTAASVTTTQSPTSSTTLFCDVSAGGFAVNLPQATGSLTEITVKKIDSSANAASIIPNSGTSDKMDNGSGTSASLTAVTISTKGVSGTWQDGAVGLWYKIGSA
jgi:hypothetical protein